MPTLKNLSSSLGLSYSGEERVDIQKVGDLTRALKSGAFTENTVYFIEKLPDSRLPAPIPENTAFLIPAELQENLSQISNNLIICKSQPKLDFINLLGNFQYQPEKETLYNFQNGAHISPHADIASTARISPGAVIGPGVVIEDDVSIGPNAIIGDRSFISKGTSIRAGAVIGHSCKTGVNCIVYENSVIGSDGFGHIDLDGKRYKVPQIGNVELGHYVEVGACTTIDRATIETTSVGDYTKIDNHVQIAHNCVVGSHVFIAGKASLAGSVTVEDHCTLAGGCGISDHVTIKKGSIILAFTGIQEDTEEKGIYFGIPARKAREMHRINSVLGHLPEIYREFKKPDRKNG